MDSLWWVFLDIYSALRDLKSTILMASLLSVWFACSLLRSASPENS